MQGILLALKQGLQKSILALSLLIFTSFCSLFIFAQQPSYAFPVVLGQLTPDEKIERAYEMSEATGLLEEDKQASANANKRFDYNTKANERSVTGSQENSEPNLIEKAQELIQKVIGNE